MKWYLAGRMTGIPQFNYPRFIEVAERLRKDGYDILSPAELDDAETVDAALSCTTGIHADGKTNGHTWGDFLSRDVKLVADECSGVILMDDWYKSRGARLEAYVACISEKQFMVVESISANGKLKLFTVSANTVLAAIFTNTTEVDVNDD